MTRRPAQIASGRRLASVDLARGVAIALMFAYHFCFDLNYLALVSLDLYRDPFWLHARTVIVTLFLLLVGVSLSLAHAQGIRWPAVRRRSVQLVVAAAVVSAGSYLLFPRSYIFFGVLHFIALASLLALPFVRRQWLALVGGVGLLWLGLGVTSPLFDQPLLNWVGLMSHKPVTEDYVPLLPWLGVVLLGVYLGGRLAALPAASPLLRWQASGPPGTALVWAGRHSLLLYLLHQPLLLGLLSLVA